MRTTTTGDTARDRGSAIGAALFLVALLCMWAAPGALAVPPPAPSVGDTDPDSPANDNSPLVKGAAETDSTVRLYTTADCSGAPEASGTAAEFAAPGISVAVADDSVTTFTATATNATDETSGCSAGLTYVEDSTAPDTTIDSGPSGAITTNQATFTFSGSPASDTAKIQCRIDTEPFSDCTSPKTFTGLTDGPHTAEFRADDAAGNQDPTPATRTFTVDTQAPNTTIDSGPSGLTNNASPSFSFSSSEGGSTFECRLDGGSFAPCTSPKSYSGLTDGAHSFEVRAIDQVGNVDASPASRAFTVDTQVPDTTIDSGPSGLINNASPSFGFSSNDGGASFECRLDSGSFAPCTSPQSYSGLTDGAHSFAVRATDQVGNVDASPASRAFTVDTQVPDTTIDSGPSGLTNNASPSFSFSSSEGGSTFECRLDSGAFQLCSSPKSYPGLADGAHSFAVRATDQVGNVDASPASRAFTVDTQVPDTTIDSGPSGLINNASPSFSFSSDDVSASFECKLDSGAFQACSSPKSYSGLAQGAHSFQVRTTDPAGNVDASPASRAFTVDTVAPETTIDAGPTDPTGNPPTPSFEFWGGASFECRFDGGAWSPCATPYASPALADGPHQFQVRSVDQAGNTDQSPAGWSFTIDTGPPQTTIDSGPAGPTKKASPRFGFSSDDTGSSFECRLDSAAWAACSSPASYDSLADGPHTFAARATDTVGNADPTPAERSFTVDTRIEGSASADSTQTPRGNRVVVKAKARAAERLRARAGGRIELGSRSYKLKRKARSIRSGSSTTFTLKPAKSKHAKRIAKALRRGRKAKAKLSVRLTDEVGNSRSKRLAIKLRR